MDAASFASQSDRTRPLFNILGAASGGALDIWNAAFKVDFFRYREQLAAIAADSHQRVSGAIVTRGLDELDDWLRSGDEEIIVPTDDDDFLSPNLDCVRRAFDSNTDLAIWSSTELGFVPIQGQVHERTTEKVFRVMRWPLLLSNNWAIRKSYVAQFPTDKARLLLAHHVEGHDLIADNLGIPADAPRLLRLRFIEHDSLRKMDDFCSLYNSHVGSIFILTEIMRTKDDPVAYLRSLDHVKAVWIPPYAAPFEPYIRRFEALSRSLVA